jgi:tetratricopeptide (TPR) repeat protein
MQYRKEQILFVLALALALWVVLAPGTKPATAGVSAKAAKLERPVTADSILVPPDSQARVLARDLFTEPSEAVPLPPRELTLPPLARLPMLRPPLDPGPFVPDWHLLRVPVPDRPSEPFNPPPLGDGEDVTEVAAGSDGGAGAQSSEDALKAARFDHIVTENGDFWGELELEGDEKFRVVDHGAPFPKLQFRWLRDSGPRMGQEIEMLSFDPADTRSAPVRRIELATTLENEIGLRRVRIPEGVDSLEQRKEFLVWLLEQARAEPRVFVEARRQAEKIVEYSQRTEEGYVWLVRVLRAEGKLEDEWQLYETIREQSGAPAWVARGRGEVLAALTLWEDARAELQMAVERNPDNARSRAALARFLLDRGEVEAAIEHAAEAFRLRTYVPRIDRAAMVGLYVESLLAAGRVADARSAMSSYAAAGGSDTAAVLLGAHAAYAAGDLAGAESAFRSLATPEAALGAGVCALARGAEGLEDAWRSLNRAIEEGPWLRARGQAALAVLHEIGGSPAAALEAARAADRADPSDPYVQYVLARMARLAGEYDVAIETCEDALRKFDGATEIVGELVLALMAKDAGNPEDASDLRRAFRYAERLVQLDRDPEAGGAVRERTYLELRGLLGYRLGDLAAARRAFEEADQRGSFFGRLGLAVIDYGQRRIDSARDALFSLANDYELPAERRDAAKRLLAEIDDHAEKEVVRDAFDRDRLGSRWQSEDMGAVRVAVEDGRVAIRGELGQGFAYARRETPQAKAFLRAEVTLQIERADQSQFAGLRLARDAAGGRAFQVRLGIDRSASQGLVPLLVVPHPERTAEQTELVIPLADALPGFDPYAEHRLVLEVIDGAPGEKRGVFGLRAIWNGRVVHELEELSGGLTPQRTDPLAIDLVATGAKGRSVGVTFDDFRLVRRHTQ